MVESDCKLAEREKVLIDNNLLKPSWENPYNLGLFLETIYMCLSKPFCNVMEGFHP